MKDFLSFEEVVQIASKKGVDFGKGNPYNRLRYYTKLGWIPHMTRRKDSKGDTKGHYPTTIIDRLVLIEQLKDQGYTNEEIERKIQLKDKVHNFYHLLKTEAVKGRLITFVSFVLILVILFLELGYIETTRNKQEMLLSTNPGTPVQIADTGNSYIPRDQKEVFIKTPYVYENSSIYVTFKSNYAPASRYWIQQKVPQEGFILELDTAVSSDSDFSWWVTF